MPLGNPQRVVTTVDASPIDLTGEIALAVNGAALRKATLALAYVGADGRPSLSLRGSAQVYDRDHLAVWARKADSGFAAEIAERPHVSLVYFSSDSPGPKYLHFEGRARAEPAANEAVHSHAIPAEQAWDPERKGVAVLIEVDRVVGLGADGPFEMRRQD